MNEQDRASAKSREAAQLNEAGEQCFTAGDFSGALQHFHQALILSPQDALTLNNIGVVLSKTGNSEKAFHILAQANATWPQDGRVLSNFMQVASIGQRLPEMMPRIYSYLAENYDEGVVASFIDNRTSLPKESRRHHQPLQKRLVVFVANKPISREAKLAFGLKRAGFDVVLICREEPNFTAADYFSGVHRYRTSDEALAMALSYNPWVYHIFANWNYEMPALFIRKRPGTIVLDDYDVMAGMVKKDFVHRTYPGNLALERFCLDNADGLCCRSLEQRYGRRFLGYRFRGKVLFLTDCCWASTEEPPLQVDKIDDGSIHVVYSGNMSPDITGPYNYHFDLAALLSKNRIHYHIYPFSTWHLTSFVPHLNAHMAANGGDTAYVHIHQPVPSDRLIGEIARYHYGVHLMWPNPRSRETDFPYEQRGFDYGSSNKIFDYIDARLSILVHRGRLQRFLVERYRNGKAIASLEDVLVTAVPKPPRVPKSYQLDANVQRLIRFYRSLNPAA